MPEFCHLHCHTQYSLLDGASDISKMLDKAEKDGQKGVAITDHGNMYGAFKFVAEARKRNIKPMVGCEFYLVKDRHVQKFSRAAGEKDVRHHQLLLAKNSKGYENLSKLCSAGFIEGNYMGFPRIDKEILVKYSEGLIATSCCIGAEIPQAILKGNTEDAEKKLQWWLDLFGEDFYIEIQRQKGLEKIDDTGMSQEDVNQILLGFAKKYKIKVIATNDSHYLEEEDWKPHDALLCINTGSVLEEKKRFKFPSSDFYFKTQAQMNKIFEDVPEAIDNTMEIYDKIDLLDLAREKVILPEFPLPQGFKDQGTYLKHLTFQGAQKRYGTITPAIEERLNFELGVINDSGYPGYFLIVQDFTSTAREMGVSVGPGRGSAAGSVVAYCLWITNIDPIKYDLLFERFLNPERVSLPDIDIDFDDEGRAKVIQYVIDKYGKEKVAQIITYGTMAAKMSIRDVGRVMNVPYGDVDKVAKAFPSSKVTLNKLLAGDDVSAKVKDSLNKDEMDMAYKFRAMAKEKSQTGDLIQLAKKLEGSVRNTGIHACGVIITPEDIKNFVPVTVAKDSDFLVSQFDNNVVEDAGLLKMDFLGLKTLTIIKDAVNLIKINKGIDIDIDAIPLDDEITYELFQRGETIAIFQYESPGMQKNLKLLKPNKFEDLIAMNALYRPGPMDYIPDFIKRKHGQAPITYDLPEMEDNLKETYGITVYQEQVMLLSQKLAGFSKGQADQLRKAMGKKKKAIIDKMYPIFLEGCSKNNFSEKIVEKIWKDWEKFAAYAFNKSHSTCYAFIAFQTAFLKANHPKEFMAAHLNHNMNDIKSLNFYLRECKRMEIEVLGPDVNESIAKFNVNEKGQIRFGLSALKGVGDGPVSALLEAREEGRFETIYDITKRSNLRSLNKRAFESMAAAGAFDSFGLSRAQYFLPYEKFGTLIEHSIKFGQNYQHEQSQGQNSLFGDMSDQLLQVPKIEKSEEWNYVMMLEKEKEVTGIYLSGHPLDQYLLEMRTYVNCKLEDIDETDEKVFKVAGMVTEAFQGVSRTNNTPYVRFTMQDFSGSFEAGLYRENCAKYADFVQLGQVIYLEGRYRQVKNSDRYYFNIIDLKLLATLSNEKTKSITLRLPLSSLTEKKMDEIDNILKSYAGDKPVKFNLLDEEEEYAVNLSSKNNLVEISTQMISQLERLGLSYKILN